MSRVCYLAGCSDCEGGMSREHYISRSVLDLIFGDGPASIIGTPWARNGVDNVSVSSLTAKILCQKHNNELTHLDSAAKDFFGAIQAAQLKLQAKTTVSTVARIDGDLLERWVLKLVAGMLVSGNFGRNGIKLLGEIPAIWRSIIMGCPYPDFWGLYFSAPVGEFATAHKEFEVVPMSDLKGNVLAVKLAMARIPMFFALGKPDNPQGIGAYRPEGLTFHDQTVEHRILFAWNDGPWCKASTYQRLRDA